MTTRTVLLSFHVAGGVLGLLVGLFAFHPPETPHFRLAIRRTYAAAIGILVTFLVAIVAVDWASLGPTPRIGLIDLGAPGWLVGAVAVGVLVVGGALVSRYKRAITSRSSAEPALRPSSQPAPSPPPRPPRLRC